MADVHDNRMVTMGIHERRERDREALRGRILEAARDILSEQGLAGLSMRGIAERIEYSPSTIYLYFRDKEELITEVVRAGFERMRSYTAAELGTLPETANAAEQYSAMGRAYVRFALENTAYFRVMFEVPGAASIECPEDHLTNGGDPEDFARVVSQVQRVAEEGLLRVEDARRTAVIGWGLIHGLVSLYVAGHLSRECDSNEAFMGLIEEAMESMFAGGVGEVSRREGRGQERRRRQRAKSGRSAAGRSG